MSKYYKAEDVQTLINSLKCYGIPELNLEGLPTIEMVDADTREFCKRLHPTWDSGYAVGFNDGRKTERNCICEDCISREWVKGICEYMLDEEMLGHMLGYIEDAPSVVPSRAEGEWIKQFNGTKCVCSICGYSNGRKHNDNYCPNCGAKMKG